MIQIKNREKEKNAHAQMAHLQLAQANAQTKNCKRVCYRQRLQTDEKIKDFVNTFINGIEI